MIIKQCFFIGWGQKPRVK